MNTLDYNDGDLSVAQAPAPANLPAISVDPITRTLTVFVPGRGNVYAGSMEYCGAYDAGRYYLPGGVVTNAGSVFVALVAQQGVTPVNGAKWFEFPAGGGGAGTLAATLALGNDANALKITNLAAGTNPHDAVRFDQTVASIQAGKGLSVDNTNPQSPIMAIIGGGTTIVPATNKPIDLPLGYSQQLQAILCGVTYTASQGVGAIKDGTRKALQISGAATFGTAHPLQIADNGSRIVCITDSSVTPVWYSDDEGFTWTAATGITAGSTAGNIVWNSVQNVFAIGITDSAATHAFVYTGNGATFTGHDVGVVVGGASVAQGVKVVYDGSLYCVAFLGNVSGALELWTAPANFSAWTQRTLGGIGSGNDALGFLFDGTNYVLLDTNNVAFAGTNIASLALVTTGAAFAYFAATLLVPTFACDGAGTFVFSDVTAGTGYFRSADGGATWAFHATTLPFTNGLYVSWNQNAHLFIGVEQTSTAANGVYETSPSGVTWTASPNTLNFQAALQW